MCVVLFGNNSPKMSVLFYMNSGKKCVLLSCVSLKVSVLIDINSDKKCVVLFYIISQKVSELFHMNFKIIQLLFNLKNMYHSCTLVNLLQTSLI